MRKIKNTLFAIVFAIISFSYSFIKVDTIHAAQDYSNYQPYKIIKSETIGEKKINNLLIIASIEPKDSQYFATYNLKLTNLSSIIKSHWNLAVEMIYVDQYEEGYIEGFDAIFLIEEYGRNIPYALFRDLANSEDKEIIWAGFGSEELVVSLLGRYLYLAPEAPEFSSLEYKGVEFFLNEFHYLGRFKLPENSEKVNVLASVINNKSEREPLILDINERFLILPFEISFAYSVDDYSLVFLDVLHNALGHHKAEKKALLRLEDIDTYTYRRPDKLVEVYDFLKNQNIPFHIALITRYINPEEGIDIELGDRFFFKKTLAQMVNEGLGTIVQHGYTHQSENGVSAYDYEFWDAENDQPLSHDSKEYVSDRVLSAQEIMKKNNLPVPDIWETPHYTASDSDEKVISSFYPLRYGDLMGLGKFPFSIKSGETIYFPENLGHVDSQDDLENMEISIKKLSVFEDPITSFFWHPWRDLDELKFLVEKLQQDNYEFVSVYDLVEKNESEAFTALTTFRNSGDLLMRYKITELWMMGSFIIFSLGGFLYIRNILRMKKYFKKIKKDRISLAKLKDLANKKGKKLPKIAIFVPAKMEGYVIENTIRRLAKLKYPKKNYLVYIITDERDIKEKPDILTKDVVDNIALELNKKFKFNFIVCLEVPEWYSGEISNSKKSYSKSSKGRALNWALQQVSKSKEWNLIDMIGVLDADGRLDINVLKEVAYKRVKFGSKLLQGPVFQVSNFGKVSLIGIAAGLELAIHHMTRLAHRLIKEKNRPQFLAGTNYFVDKNLIIEVGGWNDTSLVEDAELALRSYAKKRVVAQWLSWPEIEQTPPNFSVYRKQRDRWIHGHLDLIPFIFRARISNRDKIRFTGDIYTNLFRVFIDLGVPIGGLILIISGVLLDLGVLLRLISFILLIMSLFIWDYYGSMYRNLYNLKYIVNPHTPSGLKSTKLFFFNPLILLFNGFYGNFEHKLIQSLKLILFMPIFIIAQSVPRITGTFKYLFSKGHAPWYKTERTKEKSH